MAPAIAQQTLLAPVALEFLSSGLKQEPPVRLDLRKSTEFRPLAAETDILSSAYGSARICFSDGAEAIAGVKAELERSEFVASACRNPMRSGTKKEDEFKHGESSIEEHDASDWISVSLNIPGFRDDDTLPVFLASMLTEALLANSVLGNRLRINDRWHWKLYVDILSLSPPLSYPLPLLSLTAHLALLNTALPKLKSELNDDPLFDDDWAAAIPLFPRDHSGMLTRRPPITLLVITIGSNILFDPTSEELAVAENVIAISYTTKRVGMSSSDTCLELLSIRLVDAPSRLTAPGTLSSLSNATSIGDHTSPDSGIDTGSSWNAPCGGLKRSLLQRIVQAVIKPGGIGAEVAEAISAFST